MKLEQIYEKESDREKVPLFIGIDSHKKNWSISIRSQQIELRSFSQPPKADVLYGYLQKHFPGFDYYSCYEAGFCGFWIHYELEALGINNIVVNPSDIPSTGKEKVRKSDSVDCRKLSRSLCNGELRGVYVPPVDLQEDRLLVRTRKKLQRDTTRVKNTIKSTLMFLGYEIPLEYDTAHWNRKFRAWLRELKLKTPSGDHLLRVLLDELEGIERQRKVLEKRIVEMSAGKYAEGIRLIRSISGIGLLGAITLLVELGDIWRFTNNDRLHSFVGLVPNVYASGEMEVTGRITSRHNAYLRPLVIQCAWRAAKSDPQLFADYTKLCCRMKSNKAIIRIAKKLMNRVAFVLKNKKMYQQKK